MIKMTDYKKEVLILLILMFFLALISTVSAVNTFYTTQELNRTPPMGVSGYGAAGLWRFNK